MTPSRGFTLFGLLAATTALIGATPAVAGRSYLDQRNSAHYEVSPAMMHAIDVIVAEKMKMRRQRR